MLRRNFLALASAPLIKAPYKLLSSSDDDAKLTEVKIVFNTHDDNKDHDTLLDVYVRNKASLFLSEDIAEAKGIGGNHTEFRDPSSHDFVLALKAPNATVKSLTAPYVNIHIQPNGNDRWVFDYTVTLTFSDGRTFSSTTKGVILDQNNKDHAGVFQS